MRQNLHRFYLLGWKYENWKYIFGYKYLDYILILYNSIIIHCFLSDLLRHVTNENSAWNKLEVFWWQRSLSAVSGWVSGVFLPLGSNELGSSRWLAEQGKHREQNCSPVRAGILNRTWSLVLLFKLFCSVLEQNQVCSSDRIAQWNSPHSQSE